MTGHRTVRIACAGLLLVAAAFITGGTSAVADGNVTITITQDATPVASNGANGDFNVVVTATNTTGADLTAETLDLTTLNVPSGVSLTGSSRGLSLSLLPTDATPTVVANISAHADPSALTASGLTGTATISGGTPATVGDYPVTVNRQADLGVSLVNSPSSGIVAGQGSFAASATVSNAGPSDSHAYAVTYSITGGTGLSFASGQPDGCSPSGATLVCSTNPDLTPSGPGSSAVLPDVTVNAGADALGAYTVHAAVAPATAGVTDPNSGNDTGMATAGVVSDADLSVTADGPGIAQIAGGPGFPYTLTVTNGGPSNNHSDGMGNGYTVFLPLEPGVHFSSGAGCVAVSGGVNCSGPGLAVTGSKTFTVNVTTDPDLVPLASQVSGTDLTDTATVTLATVTGASDTNSGNNQDDATAHIDARADLALGVTTTHASGVTPPYLAGDSTNGAFSYVYTVTNNGPSDHSGSYTVTDLLPAGFAFQSGSGCSAVGSVATGQTVTCTDSAVLDPTAGPITFTVGIRVDHTVADGSYPDNASVASGTSATPEPTGSGANNSAAVSVAVYTKADMALDSAAAAPTPIYANSTPAQNTVTFTVKFHNGGPSDARHATLKLNPSLAAHLTGADWCVKVNPTDCTSDPSFTAYNSGTGIDVGQLVPGSSDQVTVLVRAHGIPTDRNGKFTGVTQGFAVSVAAPTQDPSGNNTASANAIEVDTVSTPVRNVQATAGNGNAIVTFEPPTNNGGQPITSYKVTVSPAGGGSPITVLASSPQVLCPNGITTDCYRVNVMPLNNGTLYTIDVQAQNAVGLSDYIAVNPAPEAKVTPSVNASASIVAPAASGTLTTCTVATPTSPTCEQYIIPSGTGGVFGALGNVTLGVGGFPGNLCGGQPCVGQGGTANNLLAAASNSGALAGYDNRKAPLKEVVTWDASTFKPSDKIGCCFPLSVPVYYENSFSLTNFPSKTGTLLNLHFCASPVLFGGAGNINWARPKPIPVGRYNGYFDTAGSACIRTIRVLGGTAATTKGDVQVTINLTSDSDGLAGRH